MDEDVVLVVVGAVVVVVVVGVVVVVVVVDVDDEVVVSVPGIVGREAGIVAAMTPTASDAASTRKPKATLRLIPETCIRTS